MAINTPPRPRDHPDRFIDAQEAIEESVLRLLEEAVAAGWGQDEAIAAIIAVADNKMLSLSENELLAELLRKLRKS